jgi:hypothetical protein
MSLKKTSPSADTGNNDWSERDQRFTGSSGMRPQAEARRYVYRMLETMLAHENPGDGGWIYGGFENELDVRRLKKAVAAVRREMRRKGE